MSALASRLEVLARACAAWAAEPPPPERGEAVAGEVARNGLSAREVDGQLTRITAALDEATLRRVLDLELDDAGGLDDGRLVAPREILHLAAGTVPGLLAESVLWGLAVGARNQCRPSRDDATFRHFHDLLQRIAPELAMRVEVVDEVRWQTADAAIVHGTDETVAHVRTRLAAGTPIAGFGSRDGIAVLTPDGIAGEPGWAGLLARDIDSFRGRGCMTPRHVIVLGTAAAGSTATVARRLGAALADRGAARRPSATPVDRRDAHDPRNDALMASVAGRRAVDEHVLAAIAAAAGDAVPRPAPHIVANGETSVTVLAADDLPELAVWLDGRRSTLQTAVVCAAPDERTAIERALLDGGCTRTCPPGEAHRPPVDWLYEGTGRLRPLVATRR